MAEQQDNLDQQRLLFAEELNGLSEPILLETEDVEQMAKFIGNLLGPNRASLSQQYLNAFGLATILFRAEKRQEGVLKKRS